LLGWLVGPDRDRLGLAGRSAIRFLTFVQLPSRWWAAIATVGYTYPVVRFSTPIRGRWPANLEADVRADDAGGCRSGVALPGTWAQPASADLGERFERAAFRQQQSDLVAAGKAAEATKLVKPKAKEHTLIWLSIGAIVGTILAAFSGDWFGRRPAYFLLCCLSMVSVWMLYLGNNQFGSGLLFWAFIGGVCTASFYGWLPLYLPELFSTSVRATGQGFGFNYGRILAAVGVHNGQFAQGILTDWHSG
jgi:hypothetical protein